jgi:hypothetical protein
MLSVLAATSASSGRFVDSVPGLIRRSGVDDRNLARSVPASRSILILALRVCIFGRAQVLAHPVLVSALLAHQSWPIMAHRDQIGRAAFSQLYFGVDMHRGRVLHTKFSMGIDTPCWCVVRTPASTASNEPTNDCCWLNLTVYCGLDGIL